MKTQRNSIHRIVYDSSFLVGLIDEKDKWHKHAVEISDFLAFFEHEGVVFDCVINEVVSVLARRLEEKKRKNFLKVLEEIRSKITKDKIFWTCTETIDMYDTIFDTIEEYEGKLNFHDALIVLMMEKFEIYFIVSFDKDFDLIKGIKRIHHENINLFSNFSKNLRR